MQAFADGYFLQFYDNVSRFEDATPVTILDGEVTSNIDFEMNRGGTISGTAVNGLGEPLKGANVQAYTKGIRGADDIYWFGGGVTDENGEYTLSGLESGEYIVSIHYYTRFYSITEWYDNASSEQEATPVVVVLGSDTEGIDFEVETPTEFGSISGNVSREDGTPLQTATVRLESLEDSNFQFYAVAYPDENGSYTINNVPVGKYRVALDYWSDWFYDVIWYDQVSSPEDATPVEVTNNQEVQGINFTVTTHEGVVSGKVTNVEGKPIANANIQLHNAYRGEPFPGERFIWAYANTDAEGNYSIEGLPDGEYIVSVFYCYFLGMYPDLVA